MTKEKNETKGHFVIEIAGEDIRFSTTSSDISSFMNASNQKNKVAPAYNLLTSTVHPDDEEMLLSIIRTEDKSPKSTIIMAIVEEVMLEVEPEVTIARKKRSK